MKKNKFLGAFVSLLLAVNAFAQTTITAPAEFDLAGGSYTFTQWNDTAAFGTYPPNMVFWTHATTDPTSATIFKENYKCLYNLSSRSRINGEGTDGISMVNTGNAQYEAVCDGSNPTSTVNELVNGRSAAIVLALKTLGRKNIQVSWTGRTIQKNSRVYQLKMQYKLGNTDLNNGWTDVAGGAYTSGNDGTSQTFNNTLPADANEQSVVLVRWIYIFVSGTSNRAQLGLDDITVSSVANSALAVSEVKNSTKTQVYPNPVNAGEILFFGKSTNFEIFSINGQVVKSGKGSSLSTSGLSKGTYVVKTSEGTQKLIVQ